MNYVLVSVAGIHTGNKFFTYQCSDLCKLGDIVKVPYGNKSVYGVVLDVVKKPTFKTKEILQITDLRLPNSYLELLNWLCNFYPDDLGSITNLFIPPNIKTKAQKTEAKFSVGSNIELPKPTKQQSEVLKNISTNNYSKVLLHGDTGTGKTRVFTDIINQVLEQNKSVLILTPEIGLTPQLISNISDHVKAKTIVTHSELTPAERKRVWMTAYNNLEPCVFVGPRSALFLPIENLGLIVLDEAHDGSYNQQQSPRYNALFVASKLAAITNSKIILSTATPNISDYYLTEKKGYKLLRMTELAVKDSPATGYIIDQTNKDNFRESPFLADDLIKQIKLALNNREQVMLFLNRRGSARLVQCANCGWQAICPNCGLPITYHHDLHNLICHTCNFKTKALTNCPECGNTDLLYKSPGTKAITEHVQKLFPGAKTARFDADVTASEQLHRNIDRLKNGEIDIVIGTQIISKGIDLPNLSVVGVLNADTGLNMPDFSAEENTFQQIYQVTGRVGRGHRTSTFFIQTRLPENPVLQAILHRKWFDFYNSEIHKRQVFNYPPYVYLGVAKVSKKSSVIAEKTAQKGFDLLANTKGLQVLGPAPSFYESTGGNYSWQIVLKSKKRSLILDALKKLPSEWVVLIDPPSLL